MSNRRPASESEVAIAAFHLWEREGRPDGMAEAHWHRARAMLEARGTFAEAEEAPGTAAGGPAGSAARPAVKTAGRTTAKASGRATAKAAGKAPDAGAGDRAKPAAASGRRPSPRKPRTS